MIHLLNRLPIKAFINLKLFNQQQQNHSIINICCGRLQIINKQVIYFNTTRNSTSSTSKMKDTTGILKNLRQLMKILPNSGGSINAYIVPSADAHQSEYICPRDERRAYVSGFDGSAGTVIVTETSALLWTDGRYYQQAEQQLDNNWTLMKDGLIDTPSLGKWLSKNLDKGSAVGVDPNVFSFRLWSTLYEELKTSDISLLPIEQNLIDVIWTDQPDAPANKIFTLDTSITGKSIGDKLQVIRKDMLDNGTATLIVAALDEVAWFLNMRGSDIDYNPVFFAYVIITKTDVYLFIDEQKLPTEYENHFIKNNVIIQLKKYDTVKDVLKNLVNQSKAKCWIYSGTSTSLNLLIPSNQLHNPITPICVMKSMKNPIEIEGLKQAHIEDGIALCKYFAWLEDIIAKDTVKINEISAADKLEEFRKQLKGFKGLSFTTISASGPNGAVIHYHPQEETNRPINNVDIYLCDSGAQFENGTTDVTRTMHFGTPNDFQRKCYTLVLKGQITLGTTIFPNKTKGNFLDTLARKSLWEFGLDYGHGTSHGIGHFLNVHEGPCSISYKVYEDDIGLQENMFISNEPGYYEIGKFGIRIEDIVQVVRASTEFDFNGRGALTFQTVTMCPIQTKMIIPEMLTDKERAHLNAYHKTVLETIMPRLCPNEDVLTIEWLKRETRPI